MEDNKNENSNENVNENVNENNNDNLQERLNEVLKYNEQLAEQVNKQNSEIEKLTKTKEGLLTDLQDKKSKINEYQSAAQNEEEQRALKAGDIDYLVKSRVERELAAQKDQYEEALRNVNSERDSYLEDLKKYQKESQTRKAKDFLMESIINSDVHKEAVSDVINIALTKGTVKEDGSFAFDKTINTKGDQYTAKDFLNELRNERHYLFKEVKGTNSKNNNGGSAAEMTQAEVQQKIMSFKQGSQEQLDFIAKIQKQEIKVV